jgi:hypothetical protein
MTPYHGYQILQAARPKTAAERRAADVPLGEMAQVLARLFDDLARWRSIAATGANRAGRPFCQANQDIPVQAGE